MADAWTRGQRTVVGAAGAGAVVVAVLVGAHVHVSGRTGGARLTSPGIVGDLAAAVAAALGAAAVAFALWALRPRRGAGGGRAVPHRPWWHLALDLVLPLAAAGIAAAVFEAEHRSHERSAAPGLSRAARALSSAGRGGHHGVLVPLLAGLAAASLAGLLAARARRPRGGAAGPGNVAPPGPDDALPAAASEALGALAAERDPRRAILRAYRALEAGTVRPGAARIPSEAPLEFRDRLVAAGAPFTPADRLTELFELARFSDHEVPAAWREEAVAALEALRDEQGTGS